MSVSEQERILSGIFLEMRNPLNFLPIYKKRYIMAIKIPVNPCRQEIHEVSRGI